MRDEEAIQQQLALLVTHRRTLSHLVQQAARYGGEVFTLPKTAHGLASARAAIAHIKRWLCENGVEVEDEPNDVEMPQLPSEALGRVPSDTFSSDKIDGTR
jgi:hypothetical protein